MASIHRNGAHNRLEVGYLIKEKPTLRQYGLENIDIDQLTSDYNKHVEQEKKKTRILS